MNRSNNTASRIYVGNLPEDIRTKEVEELFSKYGRIIDIEVKVPRTGSAPAFAFLQFEDQR